MSSLVIEGGVKLSGDILIPGAKNSATPILAAALLVAGQCTIHNVPTITDVEKMLNLLKSLGVEVKREGTTVVTKASNINLSNLVANDVKAMRSSILLFGPLLARCKNIRLPEPGGCIIGNRPLSAHLHGLAQMGVTYETGHDYYDLKTDGLKGARIVLPEFSVTATENLIMAAVLAKGQTVIEIAATEPHVQDLCNFLVSAGARIAGIGTHTLTIDGVAELREVEYTIIPDPIEAGTWAVLGAVARGSLNIRPVRPEHLDLVLWHLKEIGVDFEIKGDTLTVHSSRQLKPFKKLQALPYPGFPTDLQAPFSVLATQAEGTSLIHDPLYEGRMNHISELIKMGANALIADPHRVVITGPTTLYGREINSYDLRAGATLIIAALIAEGQSKISGAEIIDRGYADIENRLRAVGAKISRDTNF